MAFGAEVTLVGILTTAPTLRYTSDGRAAANFSFLVSRSYNNRQGERHETRAMFPVVCWGSLAENVGASLDKGHRVVILGRLEERSWDDEHRGHHTRIELTANEIGASMAYGPVAVTKNPRKEPVAAPPTAQNEEEEPF
jgi:single-strand DNA-binding protein